MTQIELPPRPAPKPEVELEGYWAAASDGHIGIGRCGECRKVFLPPQKVCPQCWSSDIAVEAASGCGTVEAVSVVHRHSSPAFKARLPYAIVLVRLDEGVALTSSIVDSDPDQVSIGMRVTAVFEATADGTRIPLFAPEAS
jgi:uncharacterized OB-fold protein